MSGGDGREDGDPLLAAGHEALHSGARPHARTRRATVAICFACAAAGVATAVLCARPYDSRWAQRGSTRRRGSAQGAQESWLDDLQVKAAPFKWSNETPGDCGPVWKNWTIYTNAHLNISSSSEVNSWEACCSACSDFKDPNDEKIKCDVWSYGKNEETNNLQDGCYLKSVATADPAKADDPDAKCPSFIHIPGIYSGTTKYALDNNLVSSLTLCVTTTTTITEPTTTIETTTTIEPTGDPDAAAAAAAAGGDSGGLSELSPTMTTAATATTTTTSSKLLGGATNTRGATNTTSPPLLGSVSEYLHPPKLLWLLLAMLIVLLLCLTCALALANTGHSKKSSRSASISSPKEEHHSVAQRESLMPAPTQMVAQGPMIPVTQRLPEPPPNLEDTYAKGFIDGMVQWVRENNPSPHYTPTVQPGARTVAGLPTATGVGGWQQGGLQQGDLQQAQQAAGPGPGAGGFPQAQPGAGSFPAQGNYPSARSFQQLPFPQAPVSGAASFSLPQPEPGSFVAATHR